MSEMEISLDDTLDETLSEIRSKNEMEEEEIIEEAVVEEEPIENELPSDEPLPEPSEDGIAPKSEDFEPEPEPEPEIDPELKIAPTTWRANAKAKWDSIDPEIRAEIQKREQDAMNGISNLKAQVGDYNEIKEVMRPYEALIKMEGGTPSTVVESMMKSAYTLRQGSVGQKVQMMTELASQYGFLNELVANFNQQGGVMPQAPHQQSSLSPDDVRRMLEEDREIQRQASADEAVRSQIESFQSATNEDGTLKYPYFENVRGFMSLAIESDPDITLEKAYENALWANDETRQIVLQQQQSGSQTKEHAEKAKKAKQANVRAKPSHSSQQPKPTGSVDDTMAETLAAIKARNG